MVGMPVETIEEQEDKINCRVSYSTAIEFYRGQETGHVTGSERVMAKSEIKPCSSLKR
jgi:hypothetical protein